MQKKKKLKTHFTCAVDGTPKITKRNANELNKTDNNKKKKHYEGQVDVYIVRTTIWLRHTNKHICTFFQKKLKQKYS